MSTSNHLEALREKHNRLEHAIHDEMQHTARDETALRQMKQQKLHLKEEIEKLQQTG